MRSIITKITAITLFGLGSLLLASAAHAAAPITITNIDSENVQIDVGTAATGTDFLNFFSTSTTNAGPADLAKVQYNGISPTAGVVNSSTLLSFTFPITVGTGKSGGPFTIQANTYRKVDEVANTAISVANNQIGDAAFPYLTFVSITSNGANPEYAKVGDTVTLSFIATEEIDIDNDAFAAFYFDGDSPIGSPVFENVSDFEYQLAYVTESDDKEGLVTFEIYAPDPQGNSNPEEPFVDVTDDSSVTFDKTAPVIFEALPVASPTTDTTPEYLLSVNEHGTFTYGGDCSSALAETYRFGPNTITFNALSAGVHSNCTVMLTDLAGNNSNVVAVTAFEVTVPEEPEEEEEVVISESNAGGGYNTNPSEVPGYVAPGTVFPLPQQETCMPYLTTFLKRGDSGIAVGKLQAFLQRNGFFSYPLITSFFGPITEQAVRDFQLRYASDILAPLGLVQPTGFVGPMTIAKINAISCGR